MWSACNTWDDVSTLYEIFQFNKTFSQIHARCLFLVKQMFDQIKSESGHTFYVEGYK